MTGAYSLPLSDDRDLSPSRQHSIPKDYHDKGPRINLTYRTILPL